MPLPRVHLLTCQAREESCRQTLARFARTDWPSPPRVHLDPVAEKDAPPWGHPARHQRLTEAFAFMLRAALAEPGQDDDWLLLLEDDLDFHPQLARHVAAWAALRDDHCSLASLFNSGVQAVGRRCPQRAGPDAAEVPQRDSDSVPRRGEDTAAYLAHAFAAHPDFYLGSQALLLRRTAAQEALLHWDSVPGLQCQRLAKLFGHARPLWVHKPSLVQHVAMDSSWGANIKRAADYDPGWEPSE